jgi:phenylalanine-4-hydroxylase
MAEHDQAVQQVRNEAALRLMDSMAARSERTNRAYFVCVRCDTIRDRRDMARLLYGGGLICSPSHKEYAAECQERQQRANEGA